VSNIKTKEEKEKTKNLTTEKPRGQNRGKNSLPAGFWEKGLCQMGNGCPN